MRTRLLLPITLMSIVASSFYQTLQARGEQHAILMALFEAKRKTGIPLNEVFQEVVPSAIAHDEEEVVAFLCDVGLSTSSVYVENSTPLMLAIKGKSKKVLAFLLNRIGAVPSEARTDKAPELWMRDQRGRTPLMQAVLQNCTGIINALLTLGVEPNESYDTFHMNALLYAILHCEDEGVRLLLNAGANPNVIDLNSESVLNLALTRRRYSIVQQLLETPGIRLELVDNVCRGPVFAVVTGLCDVMHESRKERIDDATRSRLEVERKQYLILLRELVRHGASVNEQEKITGLTPLMLALRHRCDDAVKALLDAHVTVNPVDDHVMSALHYAARYDNPEIVRLLIRAGAHINAVDLHKRTPLTIAIENSCASVVQYLLEQESTDVNPVDVIGSTPLIIATVRNDMNSIKALLKRHAQVDICNNAGQTALHCAVNAGACSIVKLLIESHADTTLYDNDKTAPLLLALERGDLDSAIELVRVGASLSRDEASMLATLVELVIVPAGSPNKSLVRGATLIRSLRGMEHDDTFDGIAWLKYIALLGSIIQCTPDYVHEALRLGAQPAMRDRDGY